MLCREWTSSLPDLRETSSRLYTSFTVRLAFPAPDASVTKAETGMTFQTRSATEGVSGILRGEGRPRWSKIECLVRIFVDHSVEHPDAEASVRRIQELWFSAVEVGSTTVEPAQVSRRRLRTS